MSDLDIPILDDWPFGKCGIVAIIGRPNVGKSSFLNEVLDLHMQAVSSKPQTTRKNWRGILSTENSQLIFIDTPGAHVGKTKLAGYMLDVVDKSLKDADIALCIADPSREPGAEDELVANRVKAANIPVVLMLNKSDIASSEQQQATEEFYMNILGEAQIFKAIAHNYDSLKPIIETIREAMPEGPFYYDSEDVTDAFMRDIGAELIREAAINELHKEVPHALAIEVEEWKEQPKKLKIKATIHVERESQKGIVLGQSGSKLKGITREAISKLRELVDQRIELKLYVKVSPDWRNNKGFLNSRGLT